MHKWGLSIEVDDGSMCPIALDMVGEGIRIDYYPLVTKHGWQIMQNPSMEIYLFCGFILPVV